MPEHPKRSEHLRQLIGRARRIHVLRAERAPERQRMRHQAKVMGDRIAVVDGHRVAPARPLNAHEPVGCAVPGFVPGDLAPARTFPDERRPDAIGIVLQIGERGGFRTEIASAERIVRVAPDRTDVRPVGVDEQTARGFAQRAGRRVHHARILRGELTCPFHTTTRSLLRRRNAQV